MQRFSDYYSTTKAEDDETTATSKDYVKYYASRIHNQYNKEIETVAEEAKKIIPKALEENASRLSGEFDSLLEEKRWSKRITLAVLCAISFALAYIPYNTYTRWGGVLEETLGFIEQKENPATAEIDKTLVSMGSAT